MSAVLRQDQFRSAARTHENASPAESPDYDYTDADDQIARELHRAGDVADVVMEVRNSADFLNWIAYNVEIPSRFLHEFRELDRRAKSVSKRAAELVRS